MVDVTLTLYSQKHEGQNHRDFETWPVTVSAYYFKDLSGFLEEVTSISSLTGAVKIVRKHVAIAETNGAGWRAVIDSMRPFTQKLWINLQLREKLLF